MVFGDAVALVGMMMLKVRPTNIKLKIKQSYKTTLKCQCQTELFFIFDWLCVSYALYAIGTKVYFEARSAFLALIIIVLRTFKMLLS